MRRYFIYWLLLLGAFFAAFFLARFLAAFFSWQPDDPLYEFLKILEALAPGLIILGMAAGTMVLTYLAIRKSLSYIDVTLDSARTLSKPEAEMITLPSELSEVQNELNLVRETSLRNAAAAKEAEQRKNDLIMYLAHDLKTPLASVIGYLNLLQDASDLPEETRKKYLGITMEKAERLEDLINEFFEISRFNLSNVTLDYQRIDLTRMLEQTVFEFLPILREKGLTCDLRIKEPYLLRCDPDKLQRVFDNILRNAISYSFSGSVITVSASERTEGSGTFLCLHFTNQGNAIAKEKLDRIFEQFYRVDSARSTSGGAGLGLAIAKQIVELHKGSISVHSENNATTFTVTLPVA